MSRPTRGTPAGRAYLDLQNRARAEGRGTQELLTLYVVERWLARLSVSPYADQFVLKGGILLAAFDARRPTADADALARNFANDEATVVARVVEIANLPMAVDDGVEFRTDTITSRVIRDEDLYSGIRIGMGCAIATAIVKLRLDVNFGDPVTPGPELIALPALRPGEPPIRVLGYPLETVLAEKISTAIALGPANTRVRDYADIYTLIGIRSVTQAAARGALLATAAHRRIDVVRSPARSETSLSCDPARTPLIGPASAPTVSSSPATSRSSCEPSPPLPTVWRRAADRRDTGIVTTGAGKDERESLALECKIIW